MWIWCKFPPNVHKCENFSYQCIVKTCILSSSLAPLQSAFGNNYIKQKLISHEDGLEKIEYHLAYYDFETYSSFVFIAFNICNSQEF